VKLYALKFVRHDRIEHHFRQGWVMSFPNAPMHHHHYGCELAWICACPVPGGFGPERSHAAAVELSGRMAEAMGGNV
jgi:hypothetical protein